MSDRVAGFFDVNRVDVADAEELCRRGWVPCQGDPARVVQWRRTWVERVIDRLLVAMGR